MDLKEIEKAGYAVGLWSTELKSCVINTQPPPSFDPDKRLFVPVPVPGVTQSYDVRIRESSRNFESVSSAGLSITSGSYPHFRWIDKPKTEEAKGPTKKQVKEEKKEIVVADN